MKMVAMYIPTLIVKHVVFVPPFQWDEGMTKVRLSGKTIYLSLPKARVP